MTSLTRVVRRLGVPDEERRDLDVLTPFFIMTAFKTKFGIEENRTRNKELADELRNLGLNVHKLYGQWNVQDGDSRVPVVEESFFCTVPAGQDAAEIVGPLLARFEQPAAIVSDGKTVWIQEASGNRRDLGEALQVDSLEDAYRDARQQTDDFTFASDQMLKLTNDETSQMAADLKEIAYAIYDREPDHAESIIKMAREIISHAVAGDFPKPSVLRDTLLLLKHAGVKHAIIGGIAVAVHGDARQTQDIDFLVDKLPDEQLLRDRDKMRTFSFYPARSRTGTVLTLDHTNGQVELLVATDSFREWALEGATEQDILGAKTPVITPEALIGMKLQAMSNPKRAAKDRADIVAVLGKKWIDAHLLERFLNGEEMQTLTRLLQAVEAP